MTFSESSIPDLSGQRFVITGANSGVGLEATKMLVAHRGKVVMACRDTLKMKRAAAAVRAATPDAHIDEVRLDLGSLASVREAATTIGSLGAIDALLNNAGVMAIPERKTSDGFEMQFGTNHLGHFALTGLLLPHLTPSGRVVTTSSIMHRFGKLVLDDVPVPKHYSPQRAYAMSKLANLFFTYELDRRLRAEGSAKASIGAHPGYAATNLQGVGPTMAGSAIKGLLMRLANAALAQSAKMGALPSIYGAISPDVRGGDYVGPTRYFNTRGYPEKTESNVASHDADLAARLWERSEALTGVTYPFPLAN